MVDMAHVAGLVACGLHPSPLPYADVVTTTTHKSLRGPRGAMILCKKEYAQAIDKAVFPGIQGGPHNNTIAAIAIALKEAEMVVISELISTVINDPDNLKLQKKTTRKQKNSAPNFQHPDLEQ